MLTVDHERDQERTLLARIAHRQIGRPRRAEQSVE